MSGIGRREFLAAAQGAALAVAGPAYLYPNAAHAADAANAAKKPAATGGELIVVHAAFAGRLGGESGTAAIMRSRKPTLARRMNRAPEMKTAPRAASQEMPMPNTTT